MNILVAVDEHPYSSYAVSEVSRFASNTLPDMNLLAVENCSSTEEYDVAFRMLHNYRNDMLSGMEAMAEIYGDAKESTGFQPVEKGIVEEVMSGRKTFRLRIHPGDPVKTILAEAKQASSDLLVLGCGQGDCDWGGQTGVPGKIAEGAESSVFVVKEAKRPTKVTCCLDQTSVSQASLEMINQFVTLYGVDLEIVGIQKHGELNKDQEELMGKVLDYYLERNVRAFLRLVDDNTLDSFFSASAHTDLMALWVGQKSLFQRLFPRHKVSDLVNSALSSILLLR